MESGLYPLSIKEKVFFGAILIYLNFKICRTILSFYSLPRPYAAGELRYTFLVHVLVFILQKLLTFCKQSEQSAYNSTECNRPKEVKEEGPHIMTGLLVQDFEAP